MKTICIQSHLMVARICNKSYPLGTLGNKLQTVGETESEVKDLLSHGFTETEIINHLKRKLNEVHKENLKTA